MALRPALYAPASGHLAPRAGRAVGREPSRRSKRVPWGKEQLGQRHVGC